MRGRPNDETARGEVRRLLQDFARSLGVAASFEAGFHVEHSTLF
jgi:hypothetical protein